jgi:hypothetical protein
VSLAKIASLGLLFLALSQRSSPGSVVYIYDFPGTPGSGVAADQTNPQPGNATFGDWSRVNLTQIGTSNVFDNGGWNNTSVFDSTQYASFTITADAGWHLNLSLLTFDEMRSAGGPTKGRVQLFLNGSATAYDVFNYNPTPSTQNQSFNFTPTTDANNVTTAEFRFYGWNGGDPAGTMLFDNVAVTVDVVPEPSTWIFALLPIGIVLHSLSRSLMRSDTKPGQTISSLRPSSDWFRVTPLRARVEEVRFARFNQASKTRLTAPGSRNRHIYCFYRIENL